MLFVSPCQQLDGSMMGMLPRFKDPLYRMRTGEHEGFGRGVWLPNTRPRGGSWFVLMYHFRLDQVKRSAGNSSAYMFFIARDMIFPSPLIFLVICLAFPSAASIAQLSTHPPEGICCIRPCHHKFITSAPHDLAFVRPQVTWQLQS